MFLKPVSYSLRNPTWLGERIHECRYAVREKLAVSIGAFAEREKTDRLNLEKRKCFGRTLLSLLTRSRHAYTLTVGPRLGSAACYRERSYRGRDKSLLGKTTRATLFG